ncbi:discoidin domain-containing protein [Pseudoflavitalea rhizosphaerae]|uniref:discoidin domain-containing protein n=1 Tax=Pseudoflavitalea rhizosphaerae TaxID=1884793 RepID=UPI000F8F42E2|nr:discoidin domain-containing protein [Pseudoflavitalea rhizosphaerae]
MRNTHIFLFFTFVVWLTACSKDKAPAPLPEGSVQFQLDASKDTIEMPLSILKDTTIVLEFKAMLANSTAGADHWVSFAVDTTKIADYRSKFGEGSLMPVTSYLFYKPTVRISAGKNESDIAQINFGLQTKLTEYTTYVVPVVIQSVDGKVEGVATERVVYIVFKTGKPLFINKDGWTIAGVSSVYATLAAANVLDNNNLSTYWASNITESMPQWITINFNREIVFNGVTYYVPTALNYPNLGGYPTSIQIETSMDGTNWTNNGIFTGGIASNMQTLNTGEITARYLRFTSLASVKYISAYDAIFISGISLVP